MNILINKNKVVIAEYTDHIENVSYTYPIQKDSVTFFLNNGIKKTIIVSETLVNGVQMTSDNIDELLSDLFFLEIEIEDVKGLSQKIEAIENNKADLVDGYIPSYQLPSYVDDVIEGELVNDTEFDVEGFIIVPERGKIYVDITTNLTYRWSGSIYAEISKSIALGDTEYMAFRGDHGLASYQHSQQVSGNPHKVTKSDIGLSNVDNTSDSNKPLSILQKTYIDSIEIGGANKVIKSRLTKGYISSVNGQSSANTNYDVYDTNYYLINKNYTTMVCTLYEKLEAITGGSSRLFFYDVNQKFIEASIIWLSGGATGTTSIVGSTVINIPQNATFYRYGLVHKDVKCKIEFGNKATDWSISPEDIQEQIDDLSKRLTSMGG